MTTSRKRWLTALLVLALAAAGYFAWQKLGRDNLPPGIASGNGRIEATEIDIASKTAGRIQEILVREGDFVTTGQVLARIASGETSRVLRERGNYFYIRTSGMDGWMLKKRLGFITED